jgi:hypothetical protein
MFFVSSWFISFPNARMNQPSPGAAPHDPADVYRELRNHALGMRPEEASTEPAGGENQPYGVLMETG